jgi:hypothetical protein
MILNKRRVLLSIVGILILVVAVSGCTSQSDKNSSSYVSPNSTSSTNSSSDNSNSTSTNINSNGLSPSVNRPLSSSVSRPLSSSDSRPLSSSLVLNSPIGNGFSDLGGIGGGGGSLSWVTTLLTGIEIRISYGGPWNGWYTVWYNNVDTGASSHSTIPISGNGIKSIPISGDPEYISLFISKDFNGGDNNNPLTIEIVDNGAVLASDSTSSPFGSVSTSFWFD